MNLTKGRECTEKICILSYRNEIIMIAILKIIYKIDLTKKGKGMIR